MAGFSTPAIILRRIAYGDYDLIITFLTSVRGKVTVIAKSAKKSRKRFAGILEPFSDLEIVCSEGRRKGMPVLQEAALIAPFPGIRTDIQKTGYASYWAEIIHAWMEERGDQLQAYPLFQFVLAQLDRGELSGAELSILFQMQFLTLAGMGPNLTCCSVCRTDLENFPHPAMGFDLSKGGLICHRCQPVSRGRPTLAMGTVKGLQWTQGKELPWASRIRFSTESQQEALVFLESFVPYHLGKSLKSLRVLRELRAGRKGKRAKGREHRA